MAAATVVSMPSIWITSDAFKLVEGGPIEGEDGDGLLVAPERVRELYADLGSKE